jgi:hypothetical protein
MLTFDSMILHDLLDRAAHHARLEADGVDLVADGEAGPEERARAIVSKHRRQIPELSEQSIWLDHVKIKFGGNPRIELMFRIRPAAVVPSLVNYVASGQLDVPLSISGDLWVFTYAVGYDFDPEEARAAFLADLETTHQHLAELRGKETSWADSLVAELTARLHKRLVRTSSVTDRIAAIGYPGADPSNSAVSQTGTIQAGR